MMIKRLTLAFMLFPLLLSAQQKTLKSGIKYTLFTKTEGKTIIAGNVVTLNLEERTGSDSLIFSSAQTGKPLVMQYTGHDAKGDLREVFPLLKKGDSVTVQVPVDSMQLPPLAQRPPFLKPGGYMKYRISIKNIQTVEEAIAQKKAEANDRNTREIAALDKFLADRKIAVTKDSSGLRYYIRDTTGKQKPMPGDTVWVNYVGRTLQEKIFDSSIETVALRANLKQPGRIYVPFKFVVAEGNVISGWDKAMPFIAEGSRISVFVPSSMAYGEQGAGADIGPYATLWFDIDLVKLHRKKDPLPAVKKVMPKKSTAKKPVAKKPGAKKPVVKSTPKKG